MSSYVPLTERVAATLKRHAEERCHFDERHAKELHELTDSGISDDNCEERCHFDERHAKELHELTDSGISDDNCEAVRPLIPSLVQLLKLSGGASVAARLSLIHI